MICEEYLRDGELVRHWSDAGMMIRQEETGAAYASAVDVVPCRYSYTETDVPVEPEPAPEYDELADAVEALGILGVEEVQ